MSTTATSQSSVVTVPLLQDENGNDIPLEEVPASRLLEQLEQYHSDFVIAGKAVTEAVNIRTELYKELDLQVSKLEALQAEEDETGLDEIDLDDPLLLIESGYSFFPDVEKCSVANISNIENPRNCIVAMGNFVKVIKDNVHRFKHLPKGPLFMELKFRNKRWAGLAEMVLRPQLFSFLVDNIVDGLVLDELIEQYFPLAQASSARTDGVVCPKYHLFPFNSDIQIEARLTAISGLDLENMLEVIHFHDEDWVKFLSQKIRIEKIIFMDTENSAFLAMSSMKNSPWHCKAVYTLDGFHVHPFPAFQAARIHFTRRPIYIEHVPDIEISEVTLKIMRTEMKIREADSAVQKKRLIQFDFADLIDSTRKLYEKAKAKEKGNRPKKSKKVKVKSTKG